MNLLEFQEKFAKNCGLREFSDLKKVNASAAMIALACDILLEEIQALKQEIETLKKGKKNDSKKRD